MMLRGGYRTQYHLTYAVLCCFISERDIYGLFGSRKNREHARAARRGQGGAVDGLSR